MKFIDMGHGKRFTNWKVIYFKRNWLFRLSLCYIPNFNLLPFSGLVKKFVCGGGGCGDVNL